MSSGNRAHKAIGIEELRACAGLLGLDIVGLARLQDISKHQSLLKNWLQAGQGGEMEYLAAGGKNPKDLLSNAKSVLCFAMYYQGGALSEKPGTGYGRVARYAWGRDYHRALKKRLKRFLELVRRNFDIEIEARICADAVPLLERAMAQSAGLGFFGKNSMLIRASGEGSYFFLAEIIWDIEVIDDSKVTQAAEPNHCGTCVRCLDFCPTGAIEAPFILNARKCISYLTIEKRTALSWPEREALGEWVFGCDVCQDVCPYNKQALEGLGRPCIEDLSAAHGVGPWLLLREIFEIADDQEYLRRFAGTALMRAKRRGLLRNALCAAANLRCVELAEVILQLACSDFEELIRQHALWAAAMLARQADALPSRRVQAILESSLKDSSASVANEARLLLESR